MTTQSTITDLGALTQAMWPGGISARAMIRQGLTTTDSITKSIAEFDTYFVPVDVRSEMRCIDGRCSGREDRAHLGAQVPGGTPGAGLAYRLGVINEHLELGNFCDDAQYMLDAYEKAGLMPGDHRDTHGHGVGCGAIDKMDAALAALVNPTLVADHERLVRVLLGESFDDETYLHVMGAAVMVEGRADEYFKDRASSVKMLEERLHHMVPVLAGDHHECIVSINAVSGTTFDNKRFAQDFNGMQAFNYDVWQTIEGTTHIFTHDVRAQRRFIMARVMIAVATLMVLTDGTQQLVVRS